MTRDEMLNSELYMQSQLSVRSRNCLRRAKIHCLKDLATCTENHLKRIRNMGPKSLNEIQALLEQHGLRLKDENDEDDQFLKDIVLRVVCDIKAALNDKAIDRDLPVWEATFTGEEVIEILDNVEDYFVNNEQQ